jgi:hypothetical protein
VEICIAPLHTDVGFSRLLAINAKAMDRFGDLFIKLKMQLKYADSHSTTTKRVLRLFLNRSLILYVKGSGRHLE